MIKLQKKEEKGITLITLVVTIIVLIILAGIAISMTVGDNGIFTKAKEAKRLQITAEAKEKIGTEILDAQVEAVQKNEQLQQSKVEEIISKYGELQADGDTIKLKDNGYEISLKEIYNGTTASSGGSTGGSTGSAELDNLKAELAQTTATEGKVLKDYKAYSNGKLITGTMENYAGKTVTASSITENGDNVEVTIPSAGYYETDSKVSIPVEKITGQSIAVYHPKVTQGNSTLSIPDDYKNGTLFLIDAYDQRSHNVPGISGKTAKFTSTNVFGHIYVNVILKVYDLENDSSVNIEWTKANNNNAIDAFIIKDNVDVKYLKSSIDNSTPISVAKGEKYLYCGVCDYRQILSISSPSCIFGNVKTTFTTSTDVYMQNYYCIYLGIIEALENGTFSIGANTNQVGLYFKM